MSGVNEIRVDFPRLLRQERPREVVAVVAAGAAQRSDADVHQCRHGAVQERLHRRREARLHARRHVAEMRARRRQAQRPRQCRLHRAPPHLLRDARQLLLRRLLQGATRSSSPGTCSPRSSASTEGQACSSPSITTTTRRFELWKKIAGLSDDTHHPHRDLRQLLVDGRHRPVRPVLGDLLRPWPEDPGRPAGLRRRGRRPLHRDLEPRLHAVRAADAGRARRACRSRRSTPAWASSASPPCCRACTTTTTSTCSRR